MFVGKGRWQDRLPIDPHIAQKIFSDSPALSVDPFHQLNQRTKPHRNPSIQLNQKALVHTYPCHKNILKNNVHPYPCQQLNQKTKVHSYPCHHLNQKPTTSILKKSTY